MLTIFIYFDALLVKQEWLGVFGCIHELEHMSKHIKQKQKLYEKLWHNYILLYTIILKSKFNLLDQKTYRSADKVVLLNIKLIELNMTICMIML